MHSFSISTNRSAATLTLLTLFPYPPIVFKPNPLIINLSTCFCTSFFFSGLFIHNLALFIIELQFTIAIYVSPLFLCSRYASIIFDSSILPLPIAFKIVSIFSLLIPLNNWLALLSTPEKLESN